VYYGVCKIYDTYVGESNDIVKCSKKDEHIIRELGFEYGETTKRPRKIGYLNLDRLILAINQTGIDKLLINKIDVLKEAKIYKIIDNNDIIKFDNMEDMSHFIIKKLEMYTQLYKENILLSGDKAGNDVKI
jgi:adenylosuccinate synthase